MKKIRLLSLALLVIYSFCSCRDYEKEYQALMNELEQKGTLLDSDERRYLLLYEENGDVKANNLDSCWTVFSSKNTCEIYTFHLSVDNNGTIKVIPKTESINLQNDIISYKGEIMGDNDFYISIYPQMLLLKNEYIKYYNYHNNTLYPHLYMIDHTWENSAEWHSMSIDASVLSDKLNMSGLELQPLSGKLTLYFWALSTGEMHKVCNYFKYTNDDYGIEYRVENFNSIGNVRDFYHYVNQEIKNKQRQIYIESEKRNFIKLEDIGEAYSNNSVRADALYKGKRLKIACELSRIENNSGLLTSLGYKYKLTSRYSFLHGGFDIDAYTNDEKFVELNYSANVYMEATFVTNKGGKYVFTDCELIMAE